SRCLWLLAWVYPTAVREAIWRCPPPVMWRIAATASARSLWHDRPRGADDRQAAIALLGPPGQRPRPCLTASLPTGGTVHNVREFMNCVVHITRVSPHR